MQRCDYCGEPGHEWTTQALVDVAEWQREQRRQEFPFGDHREEPVE